MITFKRTLRVLFGDGQEHEDIDAEISLQPIEICALLEDANPQDFAEITMYMVMIMSERLPREHERHFLTSQGFSDEQRKRLKQIAEIEL